MASPFIPDPKPVAPVPPAGQYADAILRATRQAFAVQKDTYLTVQKLIHGNKDYTPKEMIAELGETYQTLQLAAVLAKTQMNYVEPGTIVDTVPEATITLPQ